MSYVSKFLVRFEITNTKTDFVQSSVLEDWAEMHRFGVSWQKISLEIKKHHVINGFSNVEGRQLKWINGKRTRVWTGVKDKML